MVKSTYLFPLCLANIIKFSQEFSCTWKISQGCLKYINIEDSLKKLGLKLPYDPAIPLLAYILRKPKLKKTHVSHCSLQHYLQ